VFLVLERAFLGRTLERRRWAAHAYTIGVVLGAWVLFRCNSLAQAADYYVALAGLSGADATRHPLGRYLDGLLVTTLIVATIFAMPVGSYAATRFDRALQRSRAAVAAITAESAWLALVFVASAATLAAGTYNPFIYFRF
jgi:alginate O-acetyltransferase complex protein AlgI